MTGLKKRQTPNQNQHRSAVPGPNSRVATAATRPQIGPTRATSPSVCSAATGQSPARASRHPGASGRWYRVLLAFTPGTLTPGADTAAQVEGQSGGQALLLAPQAPPTAAAVSRADERRTKCWGPQGVCATKPGTGKMCISPGLRQPAPRRRLGHPFRPARMHHTATDPAAGGCAAVTAGPMRARVQPVDGRLPSCWLAIRLLSPPAAPPTPSHRALLCP